MSRNIGLELIGTGDKALEQTLPEHRITTFLIQKLKERLGSNIVPSGDIETLLKALNLPTSVTASELEKLVNEHFAKLDSAK